MENASKALIMAAGVLIGVLILSLAAYLFISFGQKSRDVRDIMEKNQIMEFNTRFTKFEGTPTASIYDVISLAKFAAEYNKNNPSNKISVWLKYENLSEDFENNSNEENGEKIEELIKQNALESDPITLYTCVIDNNDYDATGKLTKATFK